MKKTKKLTLSATFTALSVVILLLASFLEIADITVSMVASAILVLAIIELGISYSVMIYLATSLISLMLLPQKFIGLVYLAFCGLYPIIKLKFDRLPRLLSWIVKFVYFNLAMTVALLGAKFIFSIELYNGIMLALYYGVANLAFVLFDILIERGCRLYFAKYRVKMRKFFK